MTCRELLRLLSEHAARHPGLLSLLARVTCYSVAHLLILWASLTWFGDTYTANVSLFILFAVFFELVTSSPVCCLWRKAFYLLCVVGVFVFGIFLTQQAMYVQAMCEAAK